MSEGKKTEEGAVFDSSQAGRSGEPEFSDIETEADAAAGGRSASGQGIRVKRGEHGDRRGPTPSDDDRAWLKQKEKAGQLPKVVKEAPAGSEVVEAWERGMARGGSGDGFVSKRGYRRIVRGLTEEEELQRADDIWTLQKIAGRVLHWRSATIFEHLFLNPILGRPAESIKELAARFNITEKRVYKIKAAAVHKVQMAHKRGEPLQAKNAVYHPSTEEWVEKACLVCGRSSFIECPLKKDCLYWPSPREVAMLKRIVIRQTPIPDWKTAEANRIAAAMERRTKQKELREAQGKPVKRKLK